MKNLLGMLFLFSTLTCCASQREHALAVPLLAQGVQSFYMDRSGSVDEQAKKFCNSMKSGSQQDDKKKLLDAVEVLRAVESHATLEAEFIANQQKVAIANRILAAVNDRNGVEECCNCYNYSSSENTCYICCCAFPLCCQPSLPQLVTRQHQKIAELEIIIYRKMRHYLNRDK